MTNEDFEYEIEAAKFYFKDTALNIPVFKDALFDQFNALPLIPKYNLYCKDVPNYNEIVKRFHNGLNVKATEENAVRVVEMSGPELELNKIRKDFYEKVGNDTIDSKHYGHHLKDAALIKTLNQIGTIIDDFENYVCIESKEEAYTGYSSSFTTNLIKYTNDLNIEDLNRALITAFIDDDKNNKVFYSAVAGSISDSQKIGLDTKYRTLKLHANNILINHLATTTKEIKVKALPKQPKEVIKTFDEAIIDDGHKVKMFEILKVVKRNNQTLFIPSTDFTVKKGYATHLFSVIKRLRDDQFFKNENLSDTLLFDLVKIRFKSTNKYNSWKNVSPILGELT